MDYEGGREKNVGESQSVFDGEKFDGVHNRQVEALFGISKEKEYSEEPDTDDVDIVMPPGMKEMDAREQMITESEEIEKREHKNVKAWVMDVKEDIERDGDDPRKLQEDWVRLANDFLDESYSRRWGDRN